jgi:hypothetical protein
MVIRRGSTSSRPQTRTGGHFSTFTGSLIYLTKLTLLSIVGRLVSKGKPGSGRFRRGGSLTLESERLVEDGAGDTPSLSSAAGTLFAYVRQTKKVTGDERQVDGHRSKKSDQGQERTTNNN